MIPPDDRTSEIRDIAELVVLATVGAALLGLAVDLAPAPAFLVNLGLVSVGPGYAVLGPGGLAAHGPASLVAASLSVSVLVSLAVLYTGWDGAAVLGVLAAVSLAGVVLRRARDRTALPRRRLIPPR